VPLTVDVDSHIEGQRLALLIRIPTHRVSFLPGQFANICLAAFRYFATHALHLLVGVVEFGAHSTDTDEQSGGVVILFRHSLTILR